MRTYNITKNLNTNAGRNKHSVALGTTRNIRGSANRIYQYCRRTTNDPFYCMFCIVKPSPSPPIRNCLNGFLSYFFEYTGSDSITEYIVEQNLPVYTIADILNVVPNVRIIDGNKVYVEISTCLYELPSYPDDIGISIGTNSDIVNFINTNTNGVTFIASTNCPFAKFGSQFKGVNNLTILPAKGTKGMKRTKELTYFTPYFLPGTSLEECFKDCTNFNSDISKWDTTNVINMASMFSGATSFNVDISDWDISSVENISYMFFNAVNFKQDISNWAPYSCLNMTNMFLGVDMNNPDSMNNRNNYDALLNSWGTNPKLSFIQNNVIFNAGLSKYTISTAQTSRNNLTTSTGSGGKGWTITDGGGVSFPSAPTISSIIPSFNLIIPDTTDILINFTPPINDGGLTITNYKYSLDDGITFISAGTTISPITVTGLSYNTYNIIIRAVNSIGDGSLSNMITVTTGSLNYSFDYTGTVPLTKQLVSDNIPIITLANMFYISSNITINVNNVNVEMRTLLYGGPYTTDFGLTFNFNSLTTFYNSNTTNLTFKSSTNCPFSRNDSQFARLNVININPNFNAYFLPETSLNSCFFNCFNFNSNISSWNTLNVIDMAYMFYGASAFNNGEITTIPTVTPITSSINSNLLTCPGAKFVTNSLISQFDALLIILMTGISFPVVVTSVVVSDISANIFSSSSGYGNVLSGLILNIQKVIPISSTLLNVTPSTSYYINTNKTLTCPGATFLNNSEIHLDDTLWFVTSSAVYIITVQSIPSNETLTISAIGIDLNVTTIRNIQKPIATQPLLFNTSNVIYMSNMFNNAFSFNQSIDTFNTSKVTDTVGMFRSAISFNQKVNHFDTSNITNMGNMFSGSTLFNQSVNFWNTSNVISMIYMFQYARIFNQSVSSWNTSNVKNMSAMFYNASMFNQSINNFDITKVTSMNYMLNTATLFNNDNIPLTWYAPNCTNFGNMFGFMSFNQPIPILVDTSGVTNISGVLMNNMFESNSSFNQNIGSWNVSKATNMGAMFNGASRFNNGNVDTIKSWKAHSSRSFASMFKSDPSFNQPLTNLVDTSGVADCLFTSMFASATTFNQDIGGWNVSKANNMSSMFQSASMFNNGESPSIQSWYAPNCTTFASMFNLATRFNQPLNMLVDTSSVIDCSLSSMFQSDSSFNQNIGGWNVSNVSDMASMFNSATQFNNGGSSDIQNWKAPLCKNFSFMFNSASNFNQPLIYLVDTSGVSSCVLNSMFFTANMFNQNVGSWNVSKVTNMGQMFRSATSFNNGESSDIQNWSAPLCTNFSFMFYLASKFNQPLTNLVNTSDVSSCDLNTMFRQASTFNNSLANWNTKNVANMDAMFQSDVSFNQNIGHFNISKVTTMASMFNSAIRFNNGGSPDIQNWSAPLCINFSFMFNSASNFNQPLTILVNTSGVSSCTLNSMFFTANMFNQNVGAWNVSNVTNMGQMFRNATSFNNGESPDIQNWKSPLCTNFSLMFNSASKFNQPLPNLVDTSGVTELSGVTMTSMFQSDSSFNQNIGSWNVSKVTNMVSMFQSAPMFNNGESNSIQLWSAPKCTSFNSMFQSASKFNQPLTNLVDTSGVSSVTMNSMFQSDSSFNQNIGNWNVSKVTSMGSMFQSASMFNNGESNSIQLWSAPKCTSFASMFSGASKFNQPLTYLVDASATNLSSMFVSASIFNNGQSGTISIPSITPLTSYYVNSTGVLTCPGASLMSSGLSINDVLIITGTNFIYSSDISTNIVSNTSLVLRIKYGSDITAGNIISIQKQIVGISPLVWNTSNVTTMANMFQNATYFNQYIRTNGNIWNTNKVTTALSMFQGVTSGGITLFNDGQIISGTTAPMEWTFAPSAILTNFRSSCRLTNSNKPLSVA